MEPLLRTTLACYERHSNTVTLFNRALLGFCENCRKDKYSNTAVD